MEKAVSCLMAVAVRKVENAERKWRVLHEAEQSRLVALYETIKIARYASENGICNSKCRPRGVYGI